MDQLKTGIFIAEMRKSKGLTQKQLADALLISDKTVSKWECGNGLPEVSLMLPLCELLGIECIEFLEKIFKNIIHSILSFRDLTCLFSFHC